MITLIHYSIVHPETGPVEIPQPGVPPLHPGSERPEIIPPDAPPVEEPVIVDFCY
ncbi:MAG TPA: hypothetical protein GXX19_08375 [Syntrophomonadaceae bacterium]|nr:hypothetical protein [Syntrophomonadaceae bacterium]